MAKKQKDTDTPHVDDGDAVEVKTNEAKSGKTEEKELTPEERIAELELALAAEHDKLLRNQAEFDNYRKRTFKEISNARMTGQVEAIEPILQVFDHFKMAVAAAENGDNLEAVQKGLEMILNEFNRSMDDLGIEQLDAVGKVFDHNIHEAVANEASADVPEGQVIRQWSCGYKMGERLLRPANVVVSSGPETEEEDA